MAGSLNSVEILGNLGRDPEVRSFQNGGKVCNLTVATSETWKDKQSGGSYGSGDGYSSGGRPSDMDDEIPFAPETRI